MVWKRSDGSQSTQSACSPRERKLDLLGKNAGLLSRMPWLRDPNEAKKRCIEPLRAHEPKSALDRNLDVP